MPIDPDLDKISKKGTLTFKNTTRIKRGNGKKLAFATILQTLPSDEALQLLMCSNEAFVDTSELPVDIEQLDEVEAEEAQLLLNSVAV